MGTFSIWHWLIVLVVVLVLFGGRGKLSGLMGDMAKGINAFKKGLKEGDGADTPGGKQQPLRRVPGSLPKPAAVPPGDPNGHHQGQKDQPDDQNLPKNLAQMPAHANSLREEPRFGNAEHRNCQ